jgi:hypothetical protein
MILIQYVHKPSSPQEADDDVCLPRIIRNIMLLSRNFSVMASNDMGCCALLLLLAALMVNS